MKQLVVVLLLSLSCVAQMRVVRGPITAAAGGGGVVANDYFERDNETPLAGGWSACTGITELWLAGNAVIYQGAGAGDGCAYWSANTPNANQYSQAKMNPGSDTTSGGQTGPCVTVRQATAADTHYRACVNGAATNNITLAKSVSGSYSNIWSRTATFTSGDTLRLEANGTTLKVFVNGVQVGANSTDTSISSGNCGLFYSASSGGMTIDDWECGNL